MGHAFVRRRAEPGRGKRASAPDGYLGGLFQHLQGLPTPVFLILLAGGIIALSEIASNTALAATVILSWARRRRRWDGRPAVADGGDARGEQRVRAARGDAAERDRVRDRAPAAGRWCSSGVALRRRVRW